MIDWDRYVGLPWRQHGRGEDGTDCWGLLRLVYERELGVDLPSYVGSYASASDREECARVLAGGRGPWLAVEPGAEREGDGVLLRLRGHECHVGVVVDSRRRMMLHQQEGTNSVLDRYDGPRWERRVAGFFRHEAAA